MTLRDRMLRLHAEAMTAKCRIFVAQDELARIDEGTRVTPQWASRVRIDLATARRVLEDLDNAITDALERMKAGAP